MFVGRKKEMEILRSALNDEKSHFIAVYGRRRIGKTYLIRQSYGGRFTFQHAGIYEGTLTEQLYSFGSSLRDAGYESETKFANWLEAFDGLKNVIKKSTEKKKIIFIDELSWMDTPKCDLMKALENFWNAFASARNDVILIVCASATSWMLSKVVHNKGGLYNRLTEKIKLDNFCLKECEEFVKESNLVLNRIQILQYYMIFGGVPYYWTFLQKGMSFSQNVDNALFSEDAPLKNEFKYLYASVFKKPDVYIKIITTLSECKTGMTREDIIEKSGIVNSGDLSKKLEELESCGFIRKYYAFGMKKKNAVYQLIDNFTLFHFKFLKEESTDEHFWSIQINQPVENTWMGLAFERVCLEHISQIKKKLGISGVLTDVVSWYCKADEKLGISGSQIDLLIVRKDQVINLCEMKYSKAEYRLDENDYLKIQNRVQDLVRGTGTKKAVYPTLVTTYGIVPNSYSNDIQSVVTMDDLFTE